MSELDSILKSSHLSISERIRRILRHDETKILAIVKDSGDRDGEFQVYVTGFAREWDGRYAPVRNTAMLLCHDIDYNEVYAVVTGEIQRVRRRYQLFPHYGEVGYDLQVVGKAKETREQIERDRYQKAEKEGRERSDILWDEIPF